MNNFAETQASYTLISRVIKLIKNKEYGKKLMKMIGDPIENCMKEL